MSDGQAPVAGDDAGHRFLPGLYREVARLVILKATLIKCRAETFDVHPDASGRPVYVARVLES